MKTISLEAAKLLGFPFGWRHFVPFRYFRQPGGKLIVQRFVGKWESISDGYKRMQEMHKQYGNPVVIEDVVYWYNHGRPRKMEEMTDVETD